MKLSPILKEWKVYNKFSHLAGFRYSLYFIKKRAFKIFRNESRQDLYSAKRLLEKSFSFDLHDTSRIFFTSSRGFLLNNHKSFWVDHNLNYLHNSLNGFFYTSFKKFYYCIHCGVLY